MEDHLKPQMLLRHEEKGSLDLYLEELRRLPLLSRDQEAIVARRARAGDEDALQELAESNLRFVVSIARKYQNRGLGLEDLIAEGNVGLMTAARKFDPDRGVRFISLAVWSIRAAILKGLARYGRPVEVPRHRLAEVGRIARVAESLRQQLGCEPTTEQLADATNLSVPTVRSLRALRCEPVALDQSLGDEKDGRTPLLDLSTGESADTLAQDGSRANAIRRALASLSPRDAKVLRLYFGLDGGREHTLEEIGAMLGVTRERVRQLRDRALKRLREKHSGLNEVAA